jgi:Tfp pilus assembly protein PilN
VGSAAAVVIGAFLYGQANVERINAERQLDSVRRVMSSLQADVVAASATGGDARSESAQRAALTALDAQGPAMARVLEAIANAAPQSVTVRSVAMTADGPHWTVRLDAFAAGADRTIASGAADEFLRALEQSAIFDERLQPPTRRFGPAAAGVEIAAAYRVAK